MTNSTSTAKEVAPDLPRLPNELLLRIAKDLPTIDDIHTLRLVGNDRISRAGLDAVQQRMSTIFVEQTKESIQRFRDICADEARARHIKEVVYVASLQTLTADELRRDRYGVWDTYPRDLAVDHLKERVVVLYESRKAEQQTLLKQRALEAALVEMVPRLPALKKFTFAGSPQIYAFMRPPLTVEAYNVETAWGGITMRRNCEQNSTSQQERTFNMIWTKARYGGTSTESVFDNPVPVFRALAKLGGNRSPRSIEIDFCEIPRSVLDDAYAVFAASEAQLMESAMAHVTAITLTQHEKSIPDDQSLEHTDLIYAARWYGLISKAKRLKSMHFNGGAHHAYRAVISAVFASQQTWPGLESLWIHVPCYWYIDVENFRHRPTFGFHDGSLLAFLKRHRTTLRDLRLINATGIDPTLGVQTAVSLRATLDFMKTGLPALQTARITHVFDANHIESTTPESPVPRPDWEALDKKAADETDLDQLARDLGVDRMMSANGIFAFEGAAQYARFKYEFGTYVLNDPSVDPTREVHGMDGRSCVDFDTWRSG
ncbi:hypothetical protein LTR36_007001 [Oleoguttula mirabilis]|uniref:F-box domain-containing protein n=1 Tax=Oleoguttula mirabilis TaxID=1507867 RepID=A0AAV9JAZ1_9PEZI|nr:hypothetical protein LTR36_007001 [Oleoguttula mirabilis]